MKNIFKLFLSSIAAFAILVSSAQAGCLSKKPKQVNNWMKVLSDNFGNSKLDEVVIPSFDCRWNFASSIMNS